MAQNLGEEKEIRLVKGLFQSIFDKHIHGFEHFGTFQEGGN